MRTIDFHAHLLTDAFRAIDELGNRTPSDEQIIVIAKALGIMPQTLAPHEMESARDALAIMFELEDKFGLAPQKDGSLRIDPKAKSSKDLIPRSRHGDLLWMKLLPVRWQKMNTTSGRQSSRSSRWRLEIVLFA